MHPEFRDHLWIAKRGAASEASWKRTAADSGSVAPAMTRRHIAQWTAVAVLLCVVADSLSRLNQLVWMLGIMSLNASLLTVLSLQQLFNSGSRGLAEPWIISMTMPFGSFVNPNNASGWLLVHVALAIGLVVVVWGKNPITTWSRSFNRPTWRDHIFEAVAIVRHRIASLNNLQILSIVTVILLLTGVAATLSRSGIVAGILGLVVCAASRMQLRKSLLLLIPFAILLAGVGLFLTAFELDTLVLAELTTLKDPVSESTSRLLHWSDSLVSVRDFPILGSGQGAYAWSTLPYQRRGRTSWFINADNQYAEILVESGVLGLSLFVAFGILLFVQSIRLIIKKTDARLGHDLWSHRIAIGLAGTAMISSQAVVAFFDFGIGLSSTMASIAVFGGILSAIWRSQPAVLETRGSWLAIDGGLIGRMLRVAFIVAACGVVDELRNADQVYPAVVESARLLNSPVTHEGLQRMPSLHEQLTKALIQYPDDPIVQDSIVKVSEAQFRFRLINTLSLPDSQISDIQLQSLWRQLTPPGLAHRVGLLEKTSDSKSFQSLQATIRNLSEEFPCHIVARDASQRMPLAPGQAVDAAAGYLSIGALDETQLHELKGVLFTDPAGSQRLFQCGVVCLAAGQFEQAFVFWDQSLLVSESFRVTTLVEASRVLAPDQVLSRFAPSEYAATVKVALANTTPQLKEGLWQLADAQWSNVKGNPTFEQRIQRARHLLQSPSPEPAMKWINESLVDYPDSLVLRRMHAELLESQEKLDEAIAEWLRYEYFDAKSSLPTESIKRLVQKRDR